MEPIIKDLTPDESIEFIVKIPNDFAKLVEFLGEQQKKLYGIIDEGPDEFAPETIFGL